MKTPPNLHTGDKIGIVATARKVSSADLMKAVSVFTEWVLDPILGQNIFNENHQFAGTDEERAQDLQQMLDDENIKAIVFARGGYGTIRVLEKINWNNFIKNPKWLVGFSDITVIHNYCQNLGVESLHAIMPISFETASNEAVLSLKSSLFGEVLEYQLEDHPFNRKGKIKAVICGGNLSILHNLSGTIADINTEGKILFIEDLDEYLYHIDRMMMNLKLSGKLLKLAGMIVGGMTQMNDNKVPFGKTAYEIIKEHTEEYDFPVCFGFPAGHFPDNRTLILGREIELEVADRVTIKF